MASPPRPYSGTSTLALVAHAFAFSFGFVYGSIKLRILKGLKHKLERRWLSNCYIGVGDLEEVRLFYYFVESKRNHIGDPFVLWLTRGCGCSGFSTLAYQIGPLCSL